MDFRLFTRTLDSSKAANIVRIIQANLRDLESEMQIQDFECRTGVLQDQLQSKKNPSRACSVKHIVSELSLTCSFQIFRTRLCIVTSRNLEYEELRQFTLNIH